MPGYALMGSAVEPSIEMRIAKQRGHNSDAFQSFVTELIEIDFPHCRIWKDFFQLFLGFFF